MTVQSNSILRLPVMNTAPLTGILLLRFVAALAAMDLSTMRWSSQMARTRTTKQRCCRWHSKLMAVYAGSPLCRHAADDM